MESIGLFSRNTQFKVAVWNWISERPNGWVLNARVQQCLFNVVKSAVYVASSEWKHANHFRRLFTNQKIELAFQCLHTVTSVFHSCYSCYSTTIMVYFRNGYANIEKFCPISKKKPPANICLWNWVTCIGCCSGTVFQVWLSAAYFWLVCSEHSWGPFHRALPVFHSFFFHVFSPLRIF